MVWGQSHFLPSLGWATLNSFWQMAFLWCLYIAANVFLKISPAKKYQLSVAAIFAGFVWFVFTFIYYFNTKEETALGFFNYSITPSNHFLHIVLSSASVAYLSLLIFPVYRFFTNWQFVQQIKKQGIQRPDLNYRLFVQKIAEQLGIRKKVLVYLSNLVKSPVTVGYLKPVVLLPVAAVSNLSVQQVEAILLHELSHIRRHDYLVNFIINIIGAFLYFNPFVKLFIRNIEEERENCCDQLVLKFDYDKISYASSLLILEKISSAKLNLALGANGREYLLRRIEKIVGVENKKRFKTNQFAGWLAALLCIVIFNSVLIIKEKKSTNNNHYAYIDFTNTFNLLPDNEGLPGTHPAPAKPKVQKKAWVAALHEKNKFVAAVTEGISQNHTVAAPDNMVKNVAFNDIENSLTNEQKDKVQSAVEATKKLLEDLQWKEAEKSIADVLTEREKMKARHEYLNALNKTINWKNVEQNMKAQYEKINWEKVNANINTAFAIIQMDSLQRVYTIALTELDKLTADSKTKQGVFVCPLPDQSIEAIKKSKEQLSSLLNTIKAIRSNKKVVRL